MSGLVVRGLTKTFGSPPVEALREVDLDVPAGTFTALVGASGSGKSTLLRIVGGLTEPTGGTVTMAGRTPSELRRDKSVGWMAQSPALLPWRTVLENVELAQTINPRPERLNGAAHLLDLVGLAGDAGTFPRKLSGGMQQRAALARTLAIGAPLWLMDEPFSALDELTRETLATDLLGIWRDLRPTVLWVTHNIPEAVLLADQVVLLTPRPGTVADVIEVGLDRPRDPTAPIFQDVVRRARDGLRGVHQARAVG